MKVYLVERWVGDGWEGHFTPHKIFRNRNAALKYIQSDKLNYSIQEMSVE